MGLPRVVVLHSGPQWPRSAALPVRRLLDTNWDVKRVHSRLGLPDLILHSCDPDGQQVRLRPPRAPLRLRYGTVDTPRCPNAFHDICVCLVERSHD